LKLGLTAEQINNPQSACGSVCVTYFPFVIYSLFMLSKAVCSTRIHFCFLHILGIEVLTCLIASQFGLLAFCNNSDDLEAKKH